LEGIVQWRGKIGELTQTLGELLKTVQGECKVAVGKVRAK